MSISSQYLFVPVLIVHLIRTVYAIQCYECSSDTLKACATLHFSEDNELPSTTCASDVSSCFTKVQNETTVRGCLAKEEATIASISKENYDICSSGKCNAHIFPEIRLSCLHCEGSSCVNQSNTIDLHPCENYIENDQCYSIFAADGSFAYRGCMSDESNGKNFCLEHSKQCRKCSELACNNDPIVWGKTLTCLKCSTRENENCDQVDDNVASVECGPTVSGYENHCFTNVNRSDVQRGCLFEATEDIQNNCYNSTDTSCLLCSESNCNHENIGEYCYQCDSKEDLNCTENITPYMGTKCAASRKGCYLIRENQNVNNLSQSIFNYHKHFVGVRRGCTSDLTEKQFNSDMYQMCSTPMCNDDIVGTEFCISCDGQNANCKNNVSSEMYKKCNSAPELMGCYHYEENDEIKRGCMSEIQDEDFRRMCESNSDQCKKCIGNACNSRQRGFQRCLVNDPTNLQRTDTIMLESKICTNYLDECYTHVANDIVRRGCLSDVDEVSFGSVDIQSDCEDLDLCKKCSGKIDCNNKEISKEFCTVCNTESEPLCKEAPNFLMRQQCPLSIRPFGCFMYKNETNFVRRDCMSTDSQLRKLCLTEGDTCKYCFGNECNKKRHFERCHYCNSDEDGEVCKIKAWKTDLKTCKYYMDQCFTYISDKGVVTRGCLSEFVSDQGDCTNKDTCVRCYSKNGCNDIPVKTESCISCDSNNNSKCKSNVTLENVEVCPQKTIQSQGCFHFINKTNGDTKRGCVINLSVSDRRLAPTQPIEWKYCIGKDNCNSRGTFTKCFYCDSFNDTNCISRPTSSVSSIKLCDDYDSSCFSYIGPHSVIRGCSSDLDWESVANCHALPEKCDICGGENGRICNDKKFSEAKCISCDSKKDERCRSQPELLNQKLCGLVDSPDEDLGCYLINDSNNRVRRGCVSDLTVQRRELCWNKSENCKICKGNNCNKKIEFQHCYTCTSKDNPNCVLSDPFDTIKICPNYMDQCLTAIDSEGFTIRKCVSNEVSEMAELEQFPMHNVCEESRCNGDIYPENRTQCFQCDGDQACNRLQPNQNESLGELPCKIYSEYDKCFMFLDGDENMYRGCMTESKDSRILCEQHPDRCIICGENGCNDRPLVVEPELWCFKCRDSTDCAFGQIERENLANCIMPVRFGLVESCYIQSHIDGTIERGCTLDTIDDDPNWCKELDDCYECTDEGCNRENIYFGYCLQCDSLNDKNCENPIFGSNEFDVQCAPIRFQEEFDKPSGIDDAYNRNNTADEGFYYEPYPFTKRGCYSLIQDGVVERGCISDLTDKEHDGCKEAKWCKICEKEYCNDRPFKSSAGTKLPTFSLCIGLLILRILHLK